MSDLVRNTIIFMSGTTTKAVTKDITPIITWCEEEYKQLDELTFTDEKDNPDTRTLTLSGAIDINNMFRESLKHCFKLLAEKVNELETEFDNRPTVDEDNDGQDILKGCIETLEGEKSNYTLKTEKPTLPKDHVATSELATHLYHTQTQLTSVISLVTDHGLLN